MTTECVPYVTAVACVSGIVKYIKYRSFVCAGKTDICRENLAPRFS